jgi:acetyl esterase/lipase
MQGRDDIIVPPEPAMELQKRLRSAGVAAAVLLLPQADHGFDLLATDWSPTARKALWHAERFLASIASVTTVSAKGGVWLAPPPVRSVGEAIAVEP